ncbi:MAG: replicative DNA helicase [candidate division KSB1 bacterium]|nr:replicative DNA helicase [candidate division KSB1 bacterium]
MAKAEETTRIPPQAMEAENSVIGAMLLSSEAVNTAVELLDETCFYKEAHKKIFMAALALHEKNLPVDVLTVANELEKRGQLEAVGGHYYLTELVERVPGTANVEHHCKIVLDRALLRKLITIADEIQQECYQHGQDAIDIIDAAERKIFALSENKARKDYTHIKPVVMKAMDKIDENSRKQGHVTGIPTGFHKLDHILSGLQNSDLIILAARPSMGKTALALNIARNAAVNGHPVAIFSLEMADYQLAMRMLCSEARLDSHRVRLGKLTESEWQLLAQSASKLFSMPIFIDDTPGITVLELRSKARRLKAEHNIGLIVIDYLQLMRLATRVENRQIEIAMISQSLKNLAKELDIPVLALSQLSRAVEARSDGRPVLSDLRESGAIEQDADVVIFIHRPAQAKGDEIDGQTRAEIIVAKQRNGPTGDIELVFLSKYVQFANLEDYREEIPVFREDLF